MSTSYRRVFTQKSPEPNLSENMLERTSQSDTYAREAYRSMPSNVRPRTRRVACSAVARTANPIPAQGRPYRVVTDTIDAFSGQTRCSSASKEHDRIGWCSAAGNAMLSSSGTRTCFRVVSSARDRGRKARGGEAPSTTPAYHWCTNTPD